jgi:3-methyladenine DNA glycosylase/8-oxoguanine DNA glycosylase
VWPVGDFGVRNGYARLYSLKKMPTPKELLPLGDPYQPYRSLVACWCWRAADTVTPD